MPQNDSFSPSRPDGSPEPVVGIPTAVTNEAARTGQIVRAVEAAIHAAMGPIKTDVERIERNGHGNFRWLLFAFAAGFLVLAGMAIEAYRWSHEDTTALATRLDTRYDKVDDRLAGQNATLIEIKTKLGDLLERIPPVPTPIRK